MERDSGAPPGGGAADARAGCIPAATRSFLGRQEELAELIGLLERSRLITLSGPPGIGKSRLGLELARQVARGYGDGATFVELAAVAEDGLVPAALASALSVQEAPGRSLTAALVGRLRRARLLLVLDNCEHLVSACAQLAGALLEGCPELCILVTSREPLGVAGEHVWQVPPLAVPALSEAASPQRLVDYPAVRLFVERAGAVEPRFSLNAYVAPAVAEICRRLDGIPLAIELAAARVAQLTPAEIARRLDDRFDLLTGEGVAEPSRHQTLAAALELSYELLSGAERALLRRLAVFRGGFDRAACEAVCCGGDADAELLHGLVSKSLVVDDARGARQRLLETIRAYAGDRLEASGDTAALREAHARFYLALAEEAEPELTGPAQERWFERLELERPNLRAALEWSVGHGRGEWALRIAGSLVLFWRVRCHFGEGCELLDAALCASDGSAARLEARALWGAGFMALWAGDNHTAISLTERSLDRFEALGDLQGRARALLTLGGCRQDRDCDGSLALFEQSAALAREAGDLWCLVHALGAAGFRCQGDGTVARELFEECLAVARAAEDKQSLRVPLVGLGQLAFAHGDYRAAEPLFEEAAVVADDLGDDYTKSWALQYLGAAVAGRDLARARELLDRALALIRAARPADLVLPLVLRARVARAEGERDLARSLSEEALTLARSGAPAAASGLVGMGELTAEEGDARTARRLYEEALDLARSAGESEASALALHALGELAREDGERKRAMVLHGEALELRRCSANAHGMVVSLDAVGGLAVESGRGELAAMLLGATDALRDEYGYGRTRAESSRYDADVESLRRSLPPAALDSAFERGAGLSLDEAVAKASNGRNGNGRPCSGWPSLTETERQVAVLVAEGLTNSQIGERLFISLGTVKDHLGRIFSKLAITARTELAREVGRQEHQPNAGRRAAPREP